MLPERCSIREAGRPCVNPPEFIISTVAGKDEYMVGVSCDRHKKTLAELVSRLQKEGKIPSGKIRFDPVKAVGTDCINAKPEDLIGL